MAKRRCKEAIIVLLVSLCLLLIIRTTTWAGNFVRLLKLADWIESPSSLPFENTTVGTGIQSIHSTIQNSTSDNHIHQLDVLKASRNYQELKNVSHLGASKHCFTLNTPSWLRGQRLGNSPVPGEWLDHVMQPHLLFKQPNIHTILDQTLCYPSGNFSNVVSALHGWNDSDTAQIHAWEFRLLFLAIHRFMHVAAFPEYQARRDCGLVDDTATTQNSVQAPDNLVEGAIGNFDYECPNAKFMVLTVNTGAGLGTTLRHGMIPSFFMALVTGRIPVLLQSVVQDKGDKLPPFLSQHFSLASCSERRDWQCVFLPVTPCVLTIEDLGNASVIDDLAMRDLRRRGALTPALHQARVILLDVPITPLGSKFKIHDAIRGKVYQMIMELLNDWKQQQPEVIVNEQWKVWTKAAEYYRVAAATNEESQSRKDRIFRAALFYLLRPNVRTRQEIAQQLKNTMPPQNDHRQYFGLPIRGTDKCRFESTCHPFDKYVQLMLLKWQQHGSLGKNGTILLTSEDPNVVHLRLRYTENTSFPLDFVVNDMDKPQGHGAPVRYQNADAVMIASLTVLKLQMQANVLVLNCCSQFHSMLRDLVQEGCGADPHMHFECLDEIDDGRFRICCGNSKEGACQQIWADHRKDPENIALMATPV